MKFRISPVKQLTSFLIAIAIVSSASVATPVAIVEHPSPTQTVASGFDGGWRLLLDNQASWKNDTLYLPDDVNLAEMPVNAPTAGWSALSASAGIPVSLPSTVEEHYWGKVPSGLPKSDAPNDIVDAEGNYIGVSWWYKTFVAPKLKRGEHLVFSFPGARLRAEVYINGKLCGYDVVGETQFDADATNALNARGLNTIAVRITNPGGNFDFIDFGTMQWGQYRMPCTHAFGGIDGDITMNVRSAVSVSDLAVFNHPDPRTVTLQATVASTGVAYSGPIAMKIIHEGSAVWSGAVNAAVPAGGSATVSKVVTVPNADLWGYNHPALYAAVASIPAADHSDRRTTFGFRWFAAQGVGSNAQLILNGRRFVPRSAISWGFWAPNGLFPDQAAANREVNAVEAFGLTGLQNHRHMPKPVVLDAFDRAGLFRYCEPGGGVLAVADGLSEEPSTQGAIDTSGTGGEPPSFLGRYELAKVLAMIKADRSHPSVSLWTLQNEMSPNLHNPRIFYVLRKMRELDPSRIILLKSGIGSQNQVFGMPYTTDFLHDDGTGYSGWWDNHTAVSSAGVYQDDMYKSPYSFEYSAYISKEISTWGEMATGASPDDAVADIAWHDAHNPLGYDVAAHKALLGAYDSFLDTYGFRSAFPATESLFREAGDKHYFSAAKIMENARISNGNDYIVLSGWESTTVEDHSGLTDSLRLLKGDPSPLKAACAPALLVVRPRHYVVATGDNAIVDVHLVNEIHLHGPYLLTVKAAGGDGKPLFKAIYPVAVIGGDTYGQPLEANIQFAPKAAGDVTVTASLAANASASPVLTRTEKLLAVDPNPAPLTNIVALAGSSDRVADALKQQFGLATAPFMANVGKVDTILAVTKSDQNQWLPFGDSTTHIEGGFEHGLYQFQMYGPPETLQTLSGLAPGKLKVELFFVETYFSAPGQRLFDVALNGQTVLNSFDIFAEAGGKDKSLVKTFTVDAPVGDLTISVPATEKDNATIAAVRVTDSAGQVIRQAFRAAQYTDYANEVWKPFVFGGFDWNAFLPAALARVHDNGTRLVLLTSGGSDADAAASALAKIGVVSYSGMVGTPGPSWLGFWYFGRQDPLLAGLPSNCVLDWPYQITSGNALMLSGPNVTGIIGYGRNHDANLGLGAASIAYGRGKILMLCIPGLADAFTGDGTGVQPVTAKRLIYNALKP